MKNKKYSLIIPVLLTAVILMSALCNNSYASFWPEDSVAVSRARYWARLCLGLELHTDPLVRLLTIVAPYTLLYREDAYITVVFTNNDPLYDFTAYPYFTLKATLHPATLKPKKIDLFVEYEPIPSGGQPTLKATFYFDDTTHSLASSKWRKKTYDKSTGNIKWEKIDTTYRLDDESTDFVGVENGFLDKDRLNRRVIHTEDTADAENTDPEDVEGTIYKREEYTEYYARRSENEGQIEKHSKTEEWKDGNLIFSETTDYWNLSGSAGLQYHNCLYKGKYASHFDHYDHDLIEVELTDIFSAPGVDRLHETRKVWKDGRSMHEYIWYDDEGKRLPDMPTVFWYDSDGRLITDDVSSEDPAGDDDNGSEDDNSSTSYTDYAGLQEDGGSGSTEASEEESPIYVSPIATGVMKVNEMIEEYQEELDEFEIELDPTMYESSSDEEMEEWLGY